MPHRSNEKGVKALKEIMRIERRIRKENPKKEYKHKK